MHYQLECHIFGIMTAMEEVDVRHFFLKDLGLALAPKMIPTNQRPSKRSTLDRHLL